MKELKEDEKAWIDVLNRMRALQASSKTAFDLRENIIPPLEKQVAEESVQLEKAQEDVEEVRRLCERKVLTIVGQAQGPTGKDGFSRSANLEERWGIGHAYFRRDQGSQVRHLPPRKRSREFRFAQDC